MSDRPTIRQRLDALGITGPGTDVDEHFHAVLDRLGEEKAQAVRNEDSIQALQKKLGEATRVELQRRADAGRHMSDPDRIVAAWTGAEIMTAIRKVMDLANQLREAGAYRRNVERAFCNLSDAAGLTLTRPEWGAGFKIYTAEDVRHMVMCATADVPTESAQLVQDEIERALKSVRP